MCGRSILSEHFVPAVGPFVGECNVPSHCFFHGEYVDWGGIRAPSVHFTLVGGPFMGGCNTLSDNFVPAVEAFMDECSAPWHGPFVRDYLCCGESSAPSVNFVSVGGRFMGECSALSKHFAPVVGLSMGQ